MEETKFFTKTKLIILGALLALIILTVVIIIVRKNKLRDEYITYQNQLEYAASNYLLKEKITLDKGDWREISVSDILKQKLITNKRSNDCEGYVIAQNNNGTNDYKAYIKCKNIYVTDGYGTKSATGTQNTKKTQSQNDTEKPKITLFGDSTITLEVGDSYKELGAMAIDNIDKDISNKIKISGEVDTTKVGTYKVKYTVSDSSNNKSSITRTVIVKENENSEKNKKETKDVTKPQIEFSNPNAYQRICTGDKVDISINGAYGYVARDDVDGDITPSVRVTGQTGVINIVGTYTLTYEVSDKAGNKTSVQRNFEVKSCSPTPTPTPVPTPTPTPTPTPQPTPTPTPQPPEQPTIPDTDPNVPVTNLIVTPSAKTISVGNTYQLTVSIIPSNATNKTLTYTTSNSRVATVTSNGLIRGISKGTAEIRVTSSNGKVGKCNITVQ